MQNYIQYIHCYPGHPVKVKIEIISTYLKKQKG